MFGHSYRYRLKILLKNRALLFWTLAFPLILGVFFNAAFGNLDKTFEFETVKVALVDGENQDQQLIDLLKEAKSDGKKKVFAIKKVKDKKEAQKLLNDNKMDAAIFFRNQTPHTLIVQNGIEPMILEQFVSQYLQIQQTVHTIQKIDPALLTQNVLEKVISGENYLRNKDEDRGMSSKSFYFFTLVGMLCIYGFQWGIRNSTDEQANQSATGIRLSMIPLSKGKVIVCDLFAALTIYMIEVLIGMFFYRYVLQVDFGDRWFWVLLTTLISSIMCISLGMMIGSFSKKDYETKISVSITVMMVFSGLAGMFGTQSIKYWIDQHAPMLGFVNPVNLISDSLYKLYYYSTMQDYYFNMGWIIILGILFLVISYVVERRSQYASL